MHAPVCGVCVTCVCECVYISYVCVCVCDRDGACVRVYVLRVCVHVRARLHVRLPNYCQHSFKFSCSRILKIPADTAFVVACRCYGCNLTPTIMLLEDSATDPHENVSLI